MSSDRLRERCSVMKPDCFRGTILSYYLFRYSYFMATGLKHRGGKSDGGSGFVVEGPSSFVNAVKELDVYSKVVDDLRVRTSTGGLITVIASIIMFLLFISELYTFMTPKIEDRLSVDTIVDSTLNIVFDISFPEIECNEIGFDVMDTAGSTMTNIGYRRVRKYRIDPYSMRVLEKASGVEEVAEWRQSSVSSFLFGGSASWPNGPLWNYRIDTYKTPVSPPVDACGSCYGASKKDADGIDRKTSGMLIPPCCNSCSSVFIANSIAGLQWPDPSTVDQCKNGYVEPIGGCRIAGDIEVMKVAGNFHFAMGQSIDLGGNQHIHSINPFNPKPFNDTHLIHELRFGPNFPGLINPLNGVERYLPNDVNLGSFKYFLKVVPTAYVQLSGDRIVSAQYSVTEHFQPAVRELPGVFFIYELSPIVHSVEETRQSLSSFLTSVCAIIGGVFTVAGLIDSLLFHSGKGAHLKRASSTSSLSNKEMKPLLHH